MEGKRMVFILVGLSLIAGFAGLMSLSEATMGVGIIGLACLFGIFARIEQARAQHYKLMGSLKNRLPDTEAKD
jgi:hypothetical protein